MSAKAGADGKSFSHDLTSGNNDMNKRLGEVRTSEGSQGIWARMARGQSK